MAICCLSFRVPEMISFVISFTVMIDEDNCQLVYGMKRNRLALFLVRCQILKAIWQPLIEIMVSQTSFGHISINSSSILTVSMATESP